MLSPPLVISMTYGRRKSCNEVHQILQLDLAVTDEKIPFGSEQPQLVYVGSTGGPQTVKLLVVESALRFQLVKLPTTLCKAATKCIVTSLK